MEVKALLEQIISGKDLSQEQAESVMNAIMDGALTPAQTAAFLTALRMKGETVTEIQSAAKVMREKSTKIPVTVAPLMDTCGTGGDNSGSFNISTTVALLLAGGGFHVAKHGNRSMTSKSGSADLLESLGINLNLTPAQVGICIENAGIGFLFAPMLHSAMKNVVPVRKELAIRTIFNLLGPLTNPAGASIQIIGLFSTKLVGDIIRVLKELGTKAAFVFSGESGLDEVCIAGKSVVARLHPDGTIEEFNFDPTEYGFQKVPLSEIKGGTPEKNAQITKEILAGKTQGPKRDIVILNAGFAIAAAENCGLKDGFKKAQNLLDQGVGLVAIDKLKSLSNSF